MAPYTADMTFPTAILVVNSIGLGLSFIAVVLRFCARYVRRITMRLADYTILAAWVFALGLIISENYCVTKGGVGQKISTVTMDQLLFSDKQFIAIGVFGSLAVTFVKISILDFFLSILSINGRFRFAAIFLMGITACYGLSFTIVTLAGCQPFEANWDKASHPDYKCINTSKFYVAQTAIGAALDILILLMPVPLVWAMNAKNTRKIGLTVLFTIGILICAISLARLYYNTQETFMITHFTEYAGIAAILGGLEANLSIICACLPSFPALLQPLAEKLKSTFGSNSGSTLKILWPDFSSRRSYRHNHGSVKLGYSSKERGQGSALAEDVLEGARRQNHFANDKLYPLSTTAASRASIDGGNVWADQRQIHIQTTISSETMQMPILGERVAPSSNLP